MLKTSPIQTRERLEALIDDRKRLERELADAKRKLALSDGGGGVAPASGSAGGTANVQGVGAARIGEVKIDFRALKGIEAKELKQIADDARSQIGSGIVAFVTTSEDGKASIVVSVTPDLTAKFSAVDLVRLGSAALGGKGGGGRPDMAQAGGPDGANAAAALEAVAAGVRERA